MDDGKGNIDDKGEDIKRIERPAANGVRLKVAGNLREISRFNISLEDSVCSSQSTKIKCYNLYTQTNFIIYNKG